MLLQVVGVFGCPEVVDGPPPRALDVLAKDPKDPAGDFSRFDLTEGLD